MLQALCFVAGLLALMAGVIPLGTGLIVDRRRDFGGAWRLLLAVGSVLIVTGGLLLTWAHHF